MENVRLELNPLKGSVGKDEANMCQTEGVGGTALKHLEKQQEPRECLYSRVLDVNVNQESIQGALHRQFIDVSNHRTVYDQLTCPQCKSRVPEKD